MFKSCLEEVCKKKKIVFTFTCFTFKDLVSLKVIAIFKIEVLMNSLPISFRIFF